MGAVTGTVADKVFAPVKGLGIFHLGYDGLYIFGSSEDVNISKPVFYPIWEEITVGSIPGADLDKLSTAWAIQWGKRLYFAYASTSSTAYPDNLLVLELETKRVQHYQYTTELVCAAIDYTSNRLMAGDSLGYVWELEALGVTTDEGAAISWQVQTKEFVQFPMYFPRYARYDLSLNNGASGTGEIILSDSVKQTHTLASGRNTKKRLITGCTGTRLTVRLAGSGPVTIYGVQVE
jgi:hypothetical protein